MESIKYEQLLLNEMRLFPIHINNDLTDENMIKAMTLTENISTSLGLSLKPNDIILLAKSSDMDTIYDRLKMSLGEVKAKPMYPDFPTTVMAMDEAEFRFHQLIHYFSTYGIEQLLGVKVSKGWLPSEAGIVSDTEKTEFDEHLIADKTIELIDANKQYMIPLKKIISKRNRMTNPEKEIMLEALKHVQDNLGDICEYNISFKENLMPIFDAVLSLLNTSNQDQILKALHALCQHTGDVFTCIRYALTRRHYRMRTAERKICVKLLESYPVVDLKTNIILSHKKSLNSHIVLNYISYNQYSRSGEHKQAIKDFRDDKLTSWEAQMKYLLSNDKDHALDFIAQRPGILLRMVSWLVKLGFDSHDIKEKLMEHAESLSVQTLMTILTHFGNYKNIDDLNLSATMLDLKHKEYDTIYEICFDVLKKRLTYIDSDIKEKKVYVNESSYSFDQSTILFNKASQDGGYIRNGIVFKIPEEVEYLRFFVYWNDAKRVDIDLHTYAITNDGKIYNVGWDGNYKGKGIAFSGDITYSDAAEYIDIKMNDSSLSYVVAAIHIYSYDGNDYYEYEYEHKKIPFDFGLIDECFTGLMAVNNLNANISLYDPKNCIITHQLSNKCNFINYGFIDIQNRLLYIIDENIKEENYDNNVKTITEFINNQRFTLSTYLDMLLEAQHCELVKTEEEADVVVVLDKATYDKEISLIDQNYFADK